MIWSLCSLANLVKIVFTVSTVASHSLALIIIKAWCTFLEHLANNSCEVEIVKLLWVDNILISCCPWTLVVPAIEVLDSLYIFEYPSIIIDSLNIFVDFFFVSPPSCVSLVSTAWNDISYSVFSSSLLNVLLNFTWNKPLLFSFEALIIHHPSLSFTHCSSWLSFVFVYLIKISNSFLYCASNVKVSQLLNVLKRTSSILNGFFFVSSS